jgi:hypothetical protein
MAMSMSLWILAVLAPLAGGEGQANAFSAMEIWNDGLCEMSYYDASETIYGQPRSFVRVHLLNGQHMDPGTGVKAGAGGEKAVSVFKLNIAEEIPTQNYNYRYLTTVFLRRPDLGPFKMVTSSQEWCGTTFKHLLWGRRNVKISSFSYFGGEGDREWQRSAKAEPFEGLFLLARAAVAAGEGRDLLLLPPLRSTHQIEPEPHEARLKLGETHELTVPAGTFLSRRVTVEGPWEAWFEVEVAAPHRLLAFAAGGVSGEIRFCERRAYWRQDAASGFHPAGAAP